MTILSEKPSRRSFRLPGFDYSRPGAYFFTICVQNRKSLFGRIDRERMELNPAGRMVEGFFYRLEERFPDLLCDSFVCMPNHVHGILIRKAVIQKSKSLTQVATAPCVNLPLSDNLRWFKTMTTNAYIRGVRTRGWPAFPGRLWQRNYWERIVRNERELTDIRRYIECNPAQWEWDELNPT